MSRTFTVTAERTPGGWWALEADEVGAVSQVRRLDQAADDIREAIAYLADLSEDEVDIDVVPVLPVEFKDHLAASRKETEDAAAATRRAALESRRAAAALRSRGYTMRDIGAVMRVSYQRAQQLVAEAEDAEDSLAVANAPGDTVPFERSSPAAAH